MAAEAEHKRKEKEKREREGRERERERRERERREKERAEEEAEEEERRAAAEKKSAKAKAAQGARPPKSTSDGRKSIEKRALLRSFALFDSHTFHQVLPLIQARRASGAIARGSSASRPLSSATRMACSACTR